jgi:hypothetical protein
LVSGHSPGQEPLALVAAVRANAATTSLGCQQSARLAAAESVKPAQETLIRAVS